MNIHPNTPPKLVKKFQKAGSFHKLADEIEVNVKYVYELITQEREPTDRTPKSREIRHRLGLRKYKPRNRTKPAPRQNISSGGTTSARKCDIPSSRRFTSNAALWAKDGSHESHTPKTQNQTGLRREI
jgi:hypothetical protein